MAEAERWDQVYAGEPHLYTTEPNALLVEVAQAMAPGRALEIGVGQGRNAGWLAARGWEVTGIDPSGEGVRQAQAASAGVRVLQVAAEEFDMGVKQWDLIAGIYVHGVVLRASPRIVAALRPGGVLVVEGFHRDVMKLGIEGMTGGLLGYKTNALLRHFSQLRIERYEDCTALADWRRLQAPLVRMVARKSE
uniref:Methyltransferase type 12 n=1 Tax=Solibacter usitatus (strain Ellin6076) TaxID=234267 RepID=Q01YE3_SOLUE